MFTAVKARVPLNHKKKAKLISSLIDNSPIELSQFQEPIIANDLRIYSTSEYEQLLAKGYKSPFTDQDLVEKPFPFEYPAFKKYVAAPRVLNLVKLATCPISQRMMTNPVIVIIEYCASDKNTLVQALVCDKSSLDCLPKSMVIKRKREWPELRELIEFFSDRLKLHIKGTKEGATQKRWFTVLRQLKDDFPLWPPRNMRLIASAAKPQEQLEQSSREGKDREHKRSGPPPSTFFEPLRFEFLESDAQEQWLYANMSAKRMELIEAAEQEGESVSAPSTRICFSMCSSSRK